MLAKTTGKGRPFTASGQWRLYGVLFDTVFRIVAKPDIGVFRGGNIYTKRRLTLLTYEAGYIYEKQNVHLPQG
jgi:hypothetical protein